ncbi:aspartyl/asparaginyl beta-hydroxylase domain-containing protein [Kribbella sp. NPDC023855]|uniref:aspartyl/asparaginyl beta-hydroxylase domain-containing protein n=1 Tax=Kribbella sp. NPDC023855 TaxID=3154698 RepID=UPI0033CD00AD
MNDRKAIRNPIVPLELMRVAIERYAPDGHQRFFDPMIFPWVAELEANWQVIRNDLDRALEEREKIPRFGDLTRRQAAFAGVRWNALWLYIYGERVDENADRYAATDALLRKIPGMKTAMFSILDGNAKIPPHHGPYKGVLRYHLGMIVPQEGPSCAIRVDNEVRSWKEGRSLLFDDTYEHEVWNDDPRPRVVLFLDVLRPLPPVLDVVNRGILRVTKHAGEVRHATRTASQFAKGIKNGKG